MEQQCLTPSLLERYEASMLLHGVGDAMGYYNGKWEFTFSGIDIHEELIEMGGVENLKLDPSLCLRESPIIYLFIFNQNNNKKFFFAYCSFNL